MYPEVHGDQKLLRDLQKAQVRRIVLQEFTPAYVGLDNSGVGEADCGPDVRLLRRLLLLQRPACLSAGPSRAPLASTQARAMEYTFSNSPHALARLLSAALL